MSSLQAANSSIGVPVVEQDPFETDTLINPYPFFELLREAGPVVYLSAHKTYALSRHAEVQAALKNWSDFTSAGGVGLGDIRKGENWRSPSAIVEIDPPNHTQIRTAMNKILSPVVVRGWREAFEAEGDKMVTEVIARGTFDGVRDPAEAFVLKVFPDALGVKVDRDMIISISDFNFNSVGPQNELFWSSAKKAEPVLERFQAAFQKEAMIPGGFGQQVFQAEEDGQLPAGVASSIIRSLLRGGMDTTMSAIGSALRLLATHPDQWAMLKADPQLARAVFEETIRLESPIQSFYRTTTRAMEFSGLQLEPDVKVQMIVASGNRDPRAWQRPDEFDITRQNFGQVAFGGGVHVCIGQMIARLEAEAVLKAVARKVKTLDLAGPSNHRPINTLRTLDTLPLSVTLH